MNELAICAGYGGLSMGVRLAVPGARVVCNVEREAACVEVLAKRGEEGSLDQAPCWSDLCTFDGRPWRGVVDLISAGIPCQPWSAAGKQRGFDDERHLGEELVRVVSEVEPRFVFVENVRGFVRAGLPDLVGCLADLGFDAEWDLFSAASVGAPHKRERVFLLAYTNSGRCEPQRLERLSNHADTQRWNNLDRRCNAMGYAKRWPLGPLEDWREVPEALWPVACEPDFRGNAYGGLPWHDRLRMLGNGVVPLAAAHALLSLARRAEVAL